jgi:hypothetical protein
MLLEGVSSHSPTVDTRTIGYSSFGFWGHITTAPLNFP